MLTESELKQLANTLSGIYQDVEDACIRSICSRLKAGKQIRFTDSWRLRKLGEVKGLRTELIKEISDESKKSMVKVRSEIRKALVGAQRMDRKLVNDMLAVSKNIEDSEAFQRVMKSVERNAKKAMNLTNTRALEASIDTYKTSINRSYLDVMTGTKTADKALRDACSSLGGDGIKVTYVSDAGRITHASLDVSIRRDIVTSVNQAGIESTLAFCEENGIDLVETTWHNGCRTSKHGDYRDHSKWQGKVFSISGNTAGYEHFATACGWGEVDGIGGCNCRHSISPYIEGMPTATHEGKQTKKANREQYEAEQTQRYFERSIRAFKRESIALKAGGYDTTEVNRKLRVTQEQLRQHVAKNNLTRDYRRERVEEVIRNNTKYIAEISRNFRISNKVIAHDMIMSNTDIGYLKTEEYRVAIESIVGKKYSDAVLDCANSIIPYNRGKVNESAYVIDANGKFKKRAMNIGAYGGDLPKRLRISKGDMIVHNHPSSMGLSDADLLASIDYGTSIVALGHDGSIYMFKSNPKTNKEWVYNFTKYYNNLINPYKNAILDNRLKNKLQDKLSAKMKELAKQYDFVYEELRA